jgi:hypothetical protein
VTAARGANAPLRRWPRARICVGLALPLIVAAPSLHAQASLSQPARERRFQLGLRTGFGVPFGRYAHVRQLGTLRDTDVNALSDDAYGAIPLWLDIGYRLTPRLLLGVYAMYGFVLPKAGAATDPLGGGCPEGLDCSGAGVRFGLQGQYHFSPAAPLDPWLGLGLGYEWITSHVEGQAFGFPIDVETEHGGLELVHLQGGVDVRLSPAFTLGPFAALSVMQYMRCSATLDGEDTTCRLPDAAWHGWLVFGVRGALGL